MALVLVAFSFGRYPVSPGQLSGLLWAKLTGAPSTLPVAMETVVFRVSGPRVLSAIAIGATLAAAGSAYQGLFRNPLVSPDILDFGNQVRVLGEIAQLARRGIAVMLSTHDPDHAFLCAHRVALLHEGRLARLGPPDEVITRESLREVSGVEVAEIACADGRVVRVCVPAVGAMGRGILRGQPGHPS